jgi:23S rRNA pseudouridine1911/1915/1917 synthase
MMVAKNDKTHEILSKMIKDKDVKRTYLALVNGVINHETGTIDAPIGRDDRYREKMKVTDINSKDAITHFKVIKRFKKHTLIECMLETGRTHQIRVHMAYIGYPIVNDPVYGKEIIDKEFGQLLHSKKIEFDNPSDKKHISLEVDAPNRFYEIMEEVTE